MSLLARHWSIEKGVSQRTQRRYLNLKFQKLINHLCHSRELRIGLIKYLLIQIAMLDQWIKWSLLVGSRTVARTHLITSQLFSIHSKEAQTNISHTYYLTSTGSQIQVAYRDITSPIMAIWWMKGSISIANRSLRYNTHKLFLNKDGLCHNLHISSLYSRANHLW